MTPGSHLYVGRVRHTRLRPFRHHFQYRVFYGLFDVDELTLLDRRLRLFSLARFNLFSFDPSDHGPTDGTALRPWVERLLASAGVDLEGGPIRLLAFPRVLGYAFNPISVWYCHGPDLELRAILYEVRNTFGDRHFYVVGRDGRWRHEFEKEMHVSPFNDLNQSYQFMINRPGQRLSLSIEQSDADGVMFRAGMRLNRRPFNDVNLMRLFLTHPLLTAKVIGGIHWQALRLWLKGGTYHPHPDPPADNVSYTITPTLLK